MCAGRGIIHAEMPVHAKGKPDPRGLQLWVDLPKQVCISAALVAVSTDVRSIVQDGGTCFSIPSRGRSLRDVCLLQEPSYQELGPDQCVSVFLRVYSQFLNSNHILP